MLGFRAVSPSRRPMVPTASSPGTSSTPSAPFTLGRLLESTADYDQVFRVVRGAVHRVLGIERPGLGLALSDLPPSLGAYWQVTGNVIVMNEGLVTTMRAHSENPIEVNSFVFVILAHEYLHALGYLDEGEVRQVTAHVARTAFGPAHLATKMAEGDLWRMYPFLAYAPRGNGQRLRMVRGFDRATTDTYIR
ncbi:MAG: hypothetical protein L3J73_05180 [Thermoplasmata archaeon]|nr:hypothetical protein [Thermoplasmata archaeon]